MHTEINGAVKKTKNKKTTKYIFVETVFPSLINSFSPLPVREAREKRQSSVWLTAPGAGAAVATLQLRRHTLSLHCPLLPPSPPPCRWLLRGRRGSEWAKPSGSHLKLGWTSPISALFCLGLLWTHKLGRWRLCGGGGIVPPAVNKSQIKGKNRPTNVVVHTCWILNKCAWTECVCVCVCRQ